MVDHILLALDAELSEQRIVALRLDLGPVGPGVIDVAAGVEEGLDVLGGVVEDGHAEGGEIHVGEVGDARHGGAVDKLHILCKMES